VKKEWGSDSSLQAAFQAAFSPLLFFPLAHDCNQSRARQQAV
jgi:hypothetical protein